MAGGWSQLYLLLDRKSLPGQFYCPNVFTLSRPFRREDISCIQLSSLRQVGRQLEGNKIIVNCLVKYL